MKTIKGRLARQFLIIAFLITLTSLSRAQGLIRVNVGNPDGSPFHIVDSGMVFMPIWAHAPFRFSAELALRCSFPITEYLGGNCFLFSGCHFYIPDGMTVGVAFLAGDDADTLWYIGDIWLITYAKISDIGRTIDAMERTYSYFRDDHGMRVPGNVTISPFYIESRTSVEYPPSLPVKIDYSAYPNPFNSSVAISLSLPHEGELNLTMYDIAGCLVKDLYNGAALGNMRVIWDGTDEGGNPVASGAYFYRIEYGDRVYASRVMMIR